VAAAVAITHLRVDEVELGPANTTQARHLQEKIINKAVGAAYTDIFHARRNKDTRMSHVTCIKIPNKLCDMRDNLFACYGYQECLPVSLLLFTIAAL